MTDSQILDLILEKITLLDSEIKDLKMQQLKSVAELYFR